MISRYLGISELIVLLYADNEGSVKGDLKAAQVFPAYERLQRLKKRYDPENTFNRWFPITPAA